MLIQWLPSIFLVKIITFYNTIYSRKLFACIDVPLTFAIISKIKWFSVDSRLFCFFRFFSSLFVGSLARSSARQPLSFSLVCVRLLVPPFAHPFTHAHIYVHKYQDINTQYIYIHIYESFLRQCHDIRLAVNTWTDQPMIHTYAPRNILRVDMSVDTCRYVCVRGDNTLLLALLRLHTYIYSIYQAHRFIHSTYTCSCVALWHIILYIYVYMDVVARILPGWLFHYYI